MNGIETIRERGSVAPVALAALALGVILALALAAGGAEAKKGGNSRTFEETVFPNLPIPEDPGDSVPSIPVRSEIKVPRKHKGQRVGDLNVLSIQHTGAGPGAADEVDLWLTAPNGRTKQINCCIGDQSLGPLTLDDDTPVSICDSDMANCSLQDPDVLIRPFAGTANSAYLETGIGPLSVFNGLKVRGTWTLTAVDRNDSDPASVLNSWGLRIKAKKPPK